MLSLKQTQRPASTTRGRSLLQLPFEVVDLILDLVTSQSVPTVSDLLTEGQVYSGEKTSSQTLASTSLVCKRFRTHAARILWEKVEVGGKEPVRRHGQTLVDFLLQHPEIASLVRSLVVREGPVNDADSLYRTLRLSQLLSLMTAVRSVRLPLLNSSTMSVLDLIKETTRNIHVVVDNLAAEMLRKSDLEQLLHLPPPMKLSIGISLTLRSSQWPLIKRLLLQIPNLRALRFHQFIDPWDGVVTRPSTQDYEDLFRTVVGHPLRGGLDELHLADIIFRDSISSSGDYLFLNSIQWSGLRRLALQGSKMIAEFLPRVAGRLDSLECLRLRTMSLNSNLLGVVLAAQTRLGCFSPGQTSASFYESLFHQIPKLRELELDGVGKEFPLLFVSVPTLNKLKVHLDERFIQLSGDNTRTAEEFRRCAPLMPLITHLEVDIGQIGNLWHPAAIPGVEVDVKVYQVLNALTLFPKLRFLRIFPPYIVPGTSRTEQSTYRQPVSDEQAIKIFRHLRRLRPSLQILSISADPSVADTALSFYASSWEVSMLGDKTMLRTRQAKHHYEQVQLWEGERKLTSRNKTMPYPRPYLPDSEGWVLSTN